MSNDRTIALCFLVEARRRARYHADRLDPKRRRNYQRDPILRALDAIAAAAERPINIEKAKKRPSVAVRP